MSYNGTEKLKLLALITKYNQHQPDDNVLSQLIEKLPDQDAEMVRENIAQEATLRAQYPYTDLQNQAQELQVLLDEVLSLTHYISYEKFKWDDILAALNDMLKLVRLQKLETENSAKEQRQERMQNAKEAPAAEKIERKLKGLAIEGRKFEREEIGENERGGRTVTLPKADLVLGDQRPERLYEEIDALVHPVEVTKEKNQRTEKSEGTPLTASNPASTAAGNLPKETTSKDRRMYGPKTLSCEPKPEDEVLAHFKEPLQLLPREESPTPQKPTIKSPTKPLRPSLVRNKSKDGPKKRVSFSGTSDEISKASYGMERVTLDTNPSTAAGPWQESMESVFSGLVIASDILPEERAPRRRRGTERERHQAKLDKARYEGERVASEVRKYS